MSRPKELESLQAEMRACRRCLQAGHTITPGAIFSGTADAQIMTIGQAPGVTEVEAGRPFNAGSGTRLFEWLGRAGLSEDEFRSGQYMTSVTKCFPGKANSGGGDRVPSKEERELCAPYLRQELKLIDPKLVIPIGRLAIDLFYPSSHPLTRIIGTEIEDEGRWIVPLPHPSGASRWHQIEANRQLIQQAIHKIAARSRELGL